MEDGLISQLVQVKIRTLNAHQREQTERFGVEIVEMKNWYSGFEGIGVDRSRWQQRQIVS